MKRSLEINIKGWDKGMTTAMVGALQDAGIETVEHTSRKVQVRKTTPTEIRRVFKGLGFKIASITDGFRN